MVFVHGFNNTFKVPSIAYHESCTIRYRYLPVRSLPGHHAPVFSASLRREKYRYSPRCAGQICAPSHASQVRNIAVMAHSMGGFNDGRGSQQIAIRDGHVNAKDHGCHSESVSDLDVDVMFSKQLLPWSWRHLPFVVHVAGMTRRLHCHGAFPGVSCRLGQIDPSIRHIRLELEKTGIATVIDLTQLKAGDPCQR